MAATGTAAAESLPPLRVDPALLGLLPAPTAKPAAESPAEITPIAPPGASAPAAPAASVAQPETTPPPSSKPTPAKSTRTKTPSAPVASVAETATPLTPTQPERVPEPSQPIAPPPRSDTKATASTSGSAASATISNPPPGYKKVPNDPDSNAPVYVTADSIVGTTDQAVVAEGNVELQQNDAKLTADKVTYWQLEDEAEAVGHVRLEQPGAVITGPKGRIQMADNEGYFDQPEYTIKRETVITPQEAPDAVVAKPLHPSMPDVMLPQHVTTTGSGKAERVDLEGEGQYHFSNATYSTCPAGDNQDWFTKVADLKLDYDREVGDGKDAVVYFKGVPFLYTPVMSFSLDNQRKSGFLPATFGANSKIGIQYYQPYYWNIAPNMDATVTSRVMSKRGLQLSADLRYLDYYYTGQSRFEYLPKDSTTGESRYAYSVLHTQNFGAGFSGSLNLSGVSDANYFTDLSTRISATSQVNLLRQGVLNYGSNWWSASIALEKYQTLQNPDQPPVAIPYASLPRISLNAARYDLPGQLAFNLQGEYVNFSHPTLVDGQRIDLYPQLSLPLQSTAFYITPKIGVRATSYSLQQQQAGLPDNITRTLPIFSVDSGVTFEREVQWKGTNYTQTLEPRLYYVYIPYRDQSNIPVFDTALADFNFAQIFSENRYVGKDRIGDANQLTPALTSRLIDPESGVELIRGMIGQRYYFADERVTLPDETPRTGRTADLLVAVTGLVAPKTYVDTGWEYNPSSGDTERFNLMARYQPEIGKVLNAGYRYTRDELGQIDISGQWPFRGGWSAVGRYNYSTYDNRLIELVGGLEYSAGCWAIRGLFQRLSTTAQSETTSFFIQLELSGFSNIGSNPADVLRRTVPGYGRNYNGADSSSTTYY